MIPKIGDTVYMCLNEEANNEYWGIMEIEEVESESNLMILGPCVSKWGGNNEFEHKGRFCLRGISREWRFATDEEKEWLEACMYHGKFLEGDRIFEEMYYLHDKMIASKTPKNPIRWANWVVDILDKIPLSSLITRARPGRNSGEQYTSIIKFENLKGLVGNERGSHTSRTSQGGRSLLHL